MARDFATQQAILEGLQNGDPEMDSILRSSVEEEVEMGEKDGKGKGGRKQVIGDGEEEVGDEESVATGCGSEKSSGVCRKYM
jgi:hypothetical protein